MLILYPLALSLPHLVHFTLLVLTSNEHKTSEYREGKIGIERKESSKASAAFGEEVTRAIFSESDKWAYPWIWK